MSKKNISQVADNTPADNDLPNLPKKTILAMTFGYLGVNMAFSIQGAQMSRITQTVGANPANLGFFFLLPPLLGMIVQPLLGKYSDRTWNKRFGRRMIYLLVSAPLAAIVIALLPFSGQFGLQYGSIAALIYAALAITFMDGFSNACMLPFRMIVGDMVNNEQKNFAWAWQQVFAYAGGILAALLPFLLTISGLPNTAAKGYVPATVLVSYIVSAIVLLICSLVTVFSVKEYDPETYSKYQGINLENQKNEKTPGLFQLLKEAPRAFWEITLVELFSWIGIMYTWTYATGAMAKNIWGTTDPTSPGFQAAGNWYGVMSAVMSVVALIWAILYSKAKSDSRKKWYAFGLSMDVIGIVMLAMSTSKWMALISFIFYGIGNFTINALPYSLLTSSLKGNSKGSYIGLLNISICMPQIIGSLLSFVIFPLVGSTQTNMLWIGAVSMLISVFCVPFIKEGK